MAKEYLCAYGDCHETQVCVSINYRNEERPRFCCEEHAALWLIGRYDYRKRVETEKLLERLTYPPKEKLKGEEEIVPALIREMHK